VSLLDVLHQSVRPDSLETYEEKIRQLAERAVSRKESFHWSTFQTAIGELGNYYYVAPAESWAVIKQRGNAQELVLRLLGEKDGRRWLQETSACLLSATQTILVDRPELSYTQDEAIRAPFGVVTAVRVRSGEQEAFEEFVRKIAEGIPKVNDRWRITTRQTVVGNLREYRLLSPLEDLAQLDTLLPADVLLTQAFGQAEGGLLYRAGIAAVEHAERRIVALRPDLSNPAS